VYFFAVSENNQFLTLTEACVICLSAIARGGVYPREQIGCAAPDCRVGASVAQEEIASTTQMYCAF
jgi:hypothetical protein